MTYQKIITPFVEGVIPEDDLQAILRDTYAEFRHNAVAPMVQIGANQWVLELFHGPTLAFKDFALQLPGRLLDSRVNRWSWPIGTGPSTPGVVWTAWGTGPTMPTSI